MLLNFSQQLVVWSLLFFISSKIFTEIITRCVKSSLKKKFLEKIKTEDIALQFFSLPFDLNTDKELAMEVVKKDGTLLFSMNESLKNDKEIVLAAIQDNPLSFRYASESLKNDREIVLKAIEGNPFNISNIRDTFKKDKSFILEIIKANSRAYYYLDDLIQGDQFKNDREFAMNLVKYGVPMHHTKFGDDRDFVLEAVKSNGNILKNTWNFFFDKEIAISAVKNNQNSFDFVAQEMKEDMEIFWYSRGYFKRIVEIKTFDLRFEFILHNSKI
jgi:hypothetical protein